ncbi:MAG: hypothetical protein AMXMBFR59_36010 [Rhodanobacteraceae bacterium]
MQRYDREREARSFRGGRDNESRGNYRGDDGRSSQSSQQNWRDEDSGGSYAHEGDWRGSYTGYDDDQRYDVAQQRYGRNMGSGQDYDDGGGASRGDFGNRNQGNTGNRYGASSGRMQYGGSRSGRDDDFRRGGGHYGSASSYGNTRYGWGGQEQGGYGRQSHGSWRDYDDSGQGYVGAYGSDLGYGASQWRESGGYGDYGNSGQNVPRGGRRGGFAGYRDAGPGMGNGGSIQRGFPGGYAMQRSYGDAGQGYEGDRQAYGAGYGMGGESAQGRNYSESAGQNHRGRGPKNYMRSDERIREDLSERLSDDPLVDAADINVEVKNGVVTLTGSVDARHLKHRVEDMADQCSGVKDVENRLTIRKAATGQNLAGSPGGGSTSTGRNEETGKKH